jgi:hypothetical protein
MMNNTRMLFLFVLFFISCSSPRVVLKGQLQRVSGNSMPSPDLPAEEPPGFAGLIWFFEPTAVSQADPTREQGVYRMTGKTPLAKAEADSTGQFQVRLKPGKYSVLIGRKGLYYSNITDLDGSINPVTINRKGTPILKLRADWDAVY